MPTVLAIPGSLRSGSANHLLLRAMQRAAPAGMRIEILDLLDRLPHFNPDHDTDTPPSTVLDFRRRIGEADALVISSPEYAHGIPGSLKNALDWLVSCTEFPSQVVLVLNVSAGDAKHLQEQLVEVLGTMSARVIARPPLVSAVVRKAIAADGAIRDPVIAQAVDEALGALGAALVR